MVAIDTNVLVRYLVGDDPKQAEVARKMLEGLTPETSGFICREVIVETVWVLERAYRFPRIQIADVLIELVSTDSLVVEAADDVASAAFRYRQGGVGFSDMMILSAGRRAGHSPLYTFDRILSKVEGTSLLGDDADV